jgi:hypothetical protein
VLLLCARHHDQVDGPVSGRKFGVEELQEWKTEREALVTMLNDAAHKFGHLPDTVPLLQLHSAAAQLAELNNSTEHPPEYLR